MLNTSSLQLLRCPETRQELTFAEPALLERINSEIANQSIRNRAGQKLTRALEAGLLRTDGQVVYPVLDQIPILLIDEGIMLTELEKASGN
jgi:uncharacterized protein